MHIVDTIVFPFHSHYRDFFLHILMFMRERERERVCVQFFAGMKTMLILTRKFFINSAKLSTTFCIRNCGMAGFESV